MLPGVLLLPINILRRSELQCARLLFFFNIILYLRKLAVYHASILSFPRSGIILAVGGVSKLIDKF